MRSILLTTVLLLGGTSAWAGWIKVTEAGDTAYYVDREAVSVKGALRRVPVIHDYAQPEPGGVRSRRVTYEVDCSGERLRSVAATEHSEPMAQGKTLNAWERESDWLYVAPTTGSSLPSRTPYRPIVRYVCSG